MRQALSICHKELQPYDGARGLNPRFLNTSIRWGYTDASSIVTGIYKQYTYSFTNIYQTWYYQIVQENQTKGLICYQGEIDKLAIMPKGPTSYEGKKDQLAIRAKGKLTDCQTKRDQLAIAAKGKS